MKRKKKLKLNENMSRNSGNKSFERRRAEQQVNIGSFSSSEKENLVVDIILAFFFLFLPLAHSPFGR